MSTPVVVNIPHRLGKEEAVRRLKAGLSSARAEYNHLLKVEEEIWEGDKLRFRVGALGLHPSGEIVVAQDHVVLTVTLPWLLAKFAQGIQHAVTRKGTLLLEKK